MWPLVAFETLALKYHRSWTFAILKDIPTDGMNGLDRLAALQAGIVSVNQCCVLHYK